MTWRGRLSINGVSSLVNPQPPTVPNPIRLAIANTPDPLTAATNFLLNHNFVDGELVDVTGQTGVIGNVAVIFMVNIQHVALEAALGPALAASSKAAKTKAPKKPASKKGAATRKASPKRKQAKKPSATKKSGRTGAAKLRGARAGGGKRKAAKSSSKQPKRKANKRLSRPASKSTKKRGGKRG